MSILLGPGRNSLSRTLFAPKLTPAVHFLICIVYLYLLGMVLLWTIRSLLLRLPSMNQMAGL